MKLSKVVIPIAGLGTRMLPATKAIPKEILPLVKKPIIQIIVEEIVNAGFKEIVLITHSSKSSVENHFDSSYELEATLEKRLKRSLLKEIRIISNLDVSIQSVRQGYALGLGHAILCSKPIIQKEPFAVVLPDMILGESSKINNLSKLKEEFERTHISQILLGKIPIKEVDKYGIAKIEKNKVKKIIEKPSKKNAPSNLFVVGRYVFSNRIFDYLSKLKKIKNKELELTQALQDYLDDKNELHFSNLEGSFYDCGDQLGYAKAFIDFSLKDSEIGSDIRKHIKKKINYGKKK